jgi:hypothetical protein
MAQLSSNTRIYGFTNIDGQLTVGNVTSYNANSTLTGSLLVVGGVGVRGNVYAEGIYDTGTRVLTYLNGIDTTQNTNILNTDSIASGAYGIANLAFSGLISANQNTAIIQGVDATQNTRISSADALAKGAYDRANGSVSFSTIIVSGQPLVKANTSNAGLTFAAGSGINITTVGTSNTITISATGGSALDQFARDTANVALYGAISANSNTAIIQGVDLTQNTRIASADDLARSAYNKANTGGGSSSGYLANSVIFANTTGYLSNTSQFQFFSSNNTVQVSNLQISKGTGSITFSNSSISIYDTFYPDTSVFAIGLLPSGIKGSHGAGSISIGSQYPGANLQTQGQYSVSLGYYSGIDNQGNFSVAIGNSAGYANQGSDSVAIGDGSGSSNQGTYSVALGASAAGINQGISSVAIGPSSGYDTQGTEAVAIGDNAGATNQGAHSVAMGQSAAQTNQGTYSIAIGYSAGLTNQGNNSIAIGSQAGYDYQVSNSIIINAASADTENRLNADNPGLYINPVRNNTANISNAIFYNNTTKELTYGPLIDFTARANTVITQGVDTTQNTRISSADALAQAAYGKANTSVSFGTIYVSGQPQVKANTANAGLTFVAGSNMTITTDGTSNTITFTSTGGGGGGGISNTYYFSTNASHFIANTTSSIQLSTTNFGTSIVANTSTFRFNSLPYSGTDLLINGASAGRIQLSSGTNEMYLRSCTASILITYPSGVPGSVVIGKGTYPGTLSNTAISNSTGALVVQGGAGIQGNVVADGVTSNGTLSVANTQTSKYASMVYNSSLNTLDFLFY